MGRTKIHYTSKERKDSTQEVRETIKQEDCRGVSLEVIDRHLARAEELLGHENSFSTSNMLYNTHQLKSYWFGRVTALKELKEDADS